MNSQGVWNSGQLTDKLPLMTNGWKDGTSAFVAGTCDSVVEAMLPMHIYDERFNGGSPTTTVGTVKTGREHVSHLRSRCQAKVGTEGDDKEYRRGMSAPAL